MDEKETTKEPEKKEPAKDTGARDIPKTPQVIEDANAAAERMEEANKKREALLEREEELLARKQLAGNAEAGMQTPEKPKETDDEYAQRVMRGEANPLKDDGFI